MDPRLNSSSNDPRLPRVMRLRAPLSQFILKSDNPDLIVKAHKLAITPRNPSKGPNQAQIEHERSMWGPHPDPNQSWIEERLYQTGAAFLRETLKAVLGVGQVELAKADNPDLKGKHPDWFPKRSKEEILSSIPKQVPVPSTAPGWGEIARLFGSPAPPEQKMGIWESVIDALINHLLPVETIEAVSGAWALRSSLLSILGDKVYAIGETARDWASFHKILPSHRKEAIEWQKEHGAELIKTVKESTRRAIRKVLVNGEISNMTRSQMHQQLLDQFGTLNRDWRRTVLTETAAGAASGKLAQVAGLGGFEAVWTGTPNACPFCYRMYRRVFEIVSADSPNKNGQKQVWPGKNNIGRSSAPLKKDGTKRKENELWWPCIPAHPNCCCSWEIRKIVLPATASPREIAGRKWIDEQMAKRRKQDEEFSKFVQSKKR